MKRPLARILLVVVGAGMLAGALLTLLRPRTFEGRGPVRTITLSMRDYAFNGTNPTLVLRAGERVRFVVRNDEDSPVRHNFEIPGLGVPPAEDLDPGGIREVTVTAPLSGEYAYGCATHRGMGGKIVIRSR
ncbi:MAG TPA: cupredoxin domain-containing protein [Candidatus Eisenbacteria bacterium]